MVIVIGAILLLLPSQGRELVDGISDASKIWPILFFIAGVSFWAWYSSLSAKVALNFSEASWFEDLLARAPKSLHGEITEDYNIYTVMILGEWLRTTGLDPLVGAPTPTEVAANRKEVMDKWRAKNRAVADSLEEAGDRLVYTILLPHIYRFIVYLIAAMALVYSLSRAMDTQIGIALLALIVWVTLDLLVHWKLASKSATIDRQEAERVQRIILENGGILLKVPVILGIQFGGFFMTIWILFKEAAWKPAEFEMSSVGIALFAFGCWAFLAVVITGVLSTIRSKWKISAFVFLLIIITVMNLFFGDEFHRVDTFRDDDPERDKMSLERVRKRPTVTEAATQFDVLATADGKQSAPIVFVATAGGGIRAAYWTAVALGRLSDDLPGFPDRVFAISGVSGGSLGAAFMAALIARGHPPPEGFERTAKRLLEHDFLGPTILRMAFTEILMPLSYPVGFTDRGKALELSWSAAWRRTVEGTDNPLDSPFMALWDNIPQERWRPVLLFNATHEEQGKRIITSNVKVTEGPFTDAWDIHELLGGRDLPLSTAAHNSARFSWVSPAGTILGPDGNSRGHVVDGGYFENYGAVTTLEIARAALLEVRNRKLLLPIIIQISSDPELTPRDQPRGGESSCKTAGRVLPFDPKHDPKSVAGFYNDALAPLAGIYATRSARGIVASKELATWAECWAERELGVKPVFIHLAMCSEARPPLGWVMTSTSRDGIDALLREDEGGCNSKDLLKLKQAWSRFSKF